MHNGAKQFRKRLTTALAAVAALLAKRSAARPSAIDGYADNLSIGKYENVGSQRRKRKPCC